MNKVLFTFALIVMCMSLATANMAGGRTKINIPVEKEVQDAANFYGTSRFADKEPMVEVVAGTKQVVAGMMYQLEAKVTRKVSADSSATKCTVDEIRIGDQPWMSPRYTLYEFKVLKNSC